MGGWDRGLVVVVLLLANLTKSLHPGDLFLHRGGRPRGYFLTPVTRGVGGGESSTVRGGHETRGACRDSRHSFTFRNHRDGTLMSKDKKPPWPL